MSNIEAINIWGKANLPLSDAVRAGDYVFVSGQVPVDPETGKIIGQSVGEQTEVVLKRIAEILESAGSSLNNIIKTTVFMTDIGQFNEMNATYREFFPNMLPARSCVEIQLAIDVTLEIEAIAYAPKACPRTVV
jgi:2-iminobutanoate/2-iminopropanoate deaminase